jgi:hypothetical protein
VTGRGVNLLKIFQKVTLKAEDPEQMLLDDPFIHTFVISTHAPIIMKPQSFY